MDSNNIPNFQVSYTILNAFLKKSGNLLNAPRMLLDATILNTQDYKARIKGKVEIQRKEYQPPVHLSVVANEMGAFGSPSTMVVNL